MNVLLKIDNWLKYLEKFLMITATLMMAGILFANVVGRLVFHHSLTYAEELATMGTIYVTFAGLSYCARTNRHISMTAVFDLLKGKARKILMIIIALVVTVALIFLGYLALGYVQTLHNMGKVTPSLGIPMWMLYSVIPVFCWIAAFQYLIIFLKNILDKSSEAILFVEELPPDYDEEALVAAAGDADMDYSDDEFEVEEVPEGGKQND